MAQKNSTIPIRNINWLRDLKTVGPQGQIHGHLIAACFDDVSTAFAAQTKTLTDTQKQLADALARITALESK